jgi:excinuclease ABC subunit B
MMRELGYCSGIENYSRYFDGRSTGARPFCLIDFFPPDFLMVIDESHATVPQIRAMYGGDRSRKQNLVEYGFRLPSALDNRPLKFEEFESLLTQVIYVSATPSDYELNQSRGVVVEQLIRPTGLLDPQIEVKPSLNQIDDLLNEIELRTVKNERILVTTLTKRMAEELSKYMLRLGIKCKYIHSEVDTLERVEILKDLRMGSIDVLIGVNLLREGLDLPEVSLVAILDADKEGFLRSEKSLTQTAGRAARNVNSKVIFYADKITDSMQRTMDETNRKRAIQIDYNTKHNITPTQITRSIESSSLTGNIEFKTDPKAYVEKEFVNTAADPVTLYLGDDQLKKLYDQARKAMEKAAKELDFIEAARLRDEMLGYKDIMDKKKKNR